jgi:predicted RNA-binding Zn-ribbon protein involved in translation (DUF1610 family)
MKIENEWLDSEVNALKCEKQRKQNKKNTDNVLVFKLVLMLSAVFFYAPSLEARNIHRKMVVVDGGHRQFICHKCGMHQWQDKKNADWAGNFKCGSCGTNLGR